MKLLHKIRLSTYFFIFFFGFLAITFILNGVVLQPANLTLLTINSFLYGFYVSPILTGQKQRIDELHKTVRAEANSLFDILIKTKKLPRRTRNAVQAMIDDYIQASFKERKPAEGEDEYEKLISYCLDYDGENKDQMDKILANLVDNQKNRSLLSMQLSNKVYSNEWWITLVLYSITTGFVLMIAVKEVWIMHVVKALLCTGLSMLMISLLKLSTLTHKKAKHIWDPLDRLSTSRFHRID
jgi:hypothetical protein